MNLFSTGPKTPLSRAKAWACTGANLLLWPGLGTAAAGRKVGLVQMGISGAGVVMVLVGVVGFYGRWFNSTEVPGWRDQYSLTGLGGTALFILTWFWALFSSLSLLHEARKNEALPPII